MGVITISRGSYSRGKEIAEKLAKRLDYLCLSREILLKASEEFDVPEAKLKHAIQDPPILLDRLKSEKRKSVDFIQEAFLESIQKDNTIYHGLAGHFFAKDIPNILKVRIIANIDYRIKVIRDKEKVSEEDARKILHNIDNERSKWSTYVFGTDTHSAELYDVVLRIDCLEVDSAVEILFRMAKRPIFKSTPATFKAIQEKLSLLKSEINT
jgi:cytidylate kinase